MFESFNQQHILDVERGSIAYDSISKDSSFVVVSIGYKSFLLQLQLCKFGLISCMCLEQPLSRYHKSFLSPFMTCKTNLDYLVPFDRLNPSWLYLSRSFWDPFHDPFRNIVFSSMTILNDMTFLHTIVAGNE